jgi:hypothetical protein
MAPRFLDLQAPNGLKYSQPTGLFINNEFVDALSGQTITSVDPAYVYRAPAALQLERLPNLLTWPLKHRGAHCDRSSSRRRGCRESCSGSPQGTQGPVMEAAARHRSRYPDVTSGGPDGEG